MRPAVALCVGLSLWPALARGQQPPAPAPVRWQIRNTTRAEMWGFFRPQPAGGDPDYAFIANRLLAAADYVSRRVELHGGLQYVQFGGLPIDATGPGPLGTGPQYYEQGGNRRASRQVYVRTANLRWKPERAGVVFQVGRFGYTSGAESPSTDARIETVKRQRLDSRLIGEFEWSIYQRSFDGVRMDVDNATTHTTVLWAQPTQGGFEDRAGHPLRRVQVAAGSFSLKPRALRHSDWQGFAYRYTDRRPLAARPDNTGRAASAVDVAISSFGTSYVGAWPVRRGLVDLFGWAVWQRGQWYEEPHRATAVAAEVGYGRTGSTRVPWLRAGWFRSSGDADSTDGRHGTFFQMVPTARRYALSTAYNLMNLVDAFVQAQWRIGAVAVRADAHRLRLTKASDLWYAGSGAMQAGGPSFGFAGRRSNGSRVLGSVVEASLDWAVTGRVSINGYVSRLSGGPVVTGTFAGDRMLFGYVETVVTFVSR